MTANDGFPPLVGLLLRLSAQQWGVDMDAALRSRGVGGLTPAHAAVIPFVPAEGIQIGELARRARVRKQSMAQSVDLLVAAGYVTREADPADARVSLVRLTDKGRALGPASRDAGREVEEAWAAVVGREELEHVRSTLGRLLGIAASETPD